MLEVPGQDLRGEELLVVDEHGFPVGGPGHVGAVLGILRLEGGVRRSSRKFS